MTDIQPRRAAAANVEQSAAHLARSATAVEHTLLVLFSMFCLLAAVWRELTPRATPFADIRRVPTAGLILINGCLLLVAAAVLAGVWFASG